MLVCSVLEMAPRSKLKKECICMNHIDLRGTHYEIGLQWGAGLAAEGRSILSGVPFPITGARRAFARACLPHCRRWFPAALDELRGLAEGQDCPQEPLAAVLLSMYAMPPEPRCSCFSLRSGGLLLFGRNSDFIPALEEQNTNGLLRFTDGGCPFLGNTTAFVEMEDGVNAAGLAVGLTSVPPAVPPRPGLNAGLVLRLLLESCANVREALALLERLPLSSSQTLTLADRSGEVALAEGCPGCLAVRRPAGRTAWVGAVNSFHLPETARLRRTVADDWRAEERYVTLARALSDPGRAWSVQAGMDLLAGKQGFLCQYDRTRGQDTVWSALWDGTRLWRAEGNPGRVPFREDRRINSLIP